MKTNLKFGLAQVNNNAPNWLVYTTSIIALLLAAKHNLIDSLPGVEDSIKVHVQLWFEYVMNVVQVITALAVIFLGQDKDSTP